MEKCDKIGINLWKSDKSGEFEMCIRDRSGPKARSRDVADGQQV